MQKGPVSGTWSRPGLWDNPSNKNVHAIRSDRRRTNWSAIPAVCDADRATRPRHGISWTLARDFNRPTIRKRSSIRAQGSNRSSFSSFLTSEANPVRKAGRCGMIRSRNSFGAPPCLASTSRASFSQFFSGSFPNARISGRHPARGHFLEYFRKRSGPGASPLCRHGADRAGRDPILFVLNARALRAGIRIRFFSAVPDTISHWFFIRVNPRDPWLISSIAYHSRSPSNQLTITTSRASCGSIGFPTTSIADAQRAHKGINST
jgi:hypothetical protein